MCARNKHYDVQHPIPNRLILSTLAAICPLVGCQFSKLQFDSYDLQIYDSTLTGLE